ncbi:MAG TPA: hypothetical protein VMR73_02400 [Candidatus Paceibacterota bacterium]|nr:hypothetical protein [Candidatus Paceibacterota bacterium]
MAETPEKTGKWAYLKGVGRFYFAPELRSVATLFFMIIFAYSAIYYFANAWLALSYIHYTFAGGTVLLNIWHLFFGLAFIITLSFPFLTSLYSIFMLYEIWHIKRDWDVHVRTALTILLIVSSTLIIIFTDVSAHIIGRAPELQSFIQDKNLTGRI